MPTLDIGALQRALRDFASVRDWNKFHTPKNLVMAMSGEVGELTEIFQWLTADESRRVMAAPRRAEAVRDEVADVFNYLIRLADLLDIDLEAAALAKIAKNDAKYPAARVRGSAAKYSQLDD